MSRKYVIKVVDGFIRVFTLSMYYLAGLMGVMLCFKYHTPVAILLSYFTTLLSLIFTVLSLFALIARAIASKQISDVLYTLSSNIFFAAGFMALAYFHIHLAMHFIALILALLAAYFRRHEES